MKLRFGAWFIQRNSNLRHAFLIGPLSECPIVARQARVYHCMCCKWSFLVCDNQIAALDEHGNPLGGSEGAERFKTFGAGPCPALVQLNGSPAREAATT